MMIATTPNQAIVCHRLWKANPIGAILLSRCFIGVTIFKRGGTGTTFLYGSIILYPTPAVLKHLYLLLRNSDIGMTMRYAHLSPDHKMAAGKQLDTAIGHQAIRPALLTGGPSTATPGSKTSFIRCPSLDTRLAQFRVQGNGGCHKNIGYNRTRPGHRLNDYAPASRHRFAPRLRGNVE